MERIKTKITLAKTYYSQHRKPVLLVSACALFVIFSTGAVAAQVAMMHHRNMVAKKKAAAELRLISDGNKSDGSGSSSSKDSGAAKAGSSSKKAAGSSSSSTTANGPHSFPTLLGALNPSASYTSLYASGFREVVIYANWSSIEPGQGSFSSAATNALQAQINSATAAGLSVSLDLGSQYPASWVFSVGGTTRFVNQYGDSYGGSDSSGNNVANAVTNILVRNQLGSYISYLGSHLTGISSVRMGGGPQNQLRYPSGQAGSQANSYWFYDSTSQSTLPGDAVGWTPGTGTTAQAQSFINNYNNALTSFGLWLAQQGEASFGSAKIELMMPGWGQRPGEVDSAVAGLLVGTPDQINQGLDWADMLPVLPTNGRIVAYSTYADAAGGNGPAVYIHSILPGGILQGGESNGNGATSTAGMSLMLQYSRQWSWYAVNWNFSGQSQSPDQIYQTFASF